MTCLTALSNVNTSCFGNIICSLTKHLYSTYGQINPQEVKYRKLELYNVTFDLSLPVDYIFNAVNYLMELSDQAGIPMTDDQSINLAYVIFARIPILIQDLRACHKKPAIEKKTWANMKIHLREAQDDLNSLLITSSMLPNTQHTNFDAMTNVVTQHLLQEQASI